MTSLKITLQVGNNDNNADDDDDDKDDDKDDDNGDIHIKIMIFKELNQVGYFQFLPYP